MLEGGQCETCGSNGKFEEEMHQVEAEDRMAEELEDKRFAEKSEIDAIRESEN